MSDLHNRVAHRRRKGEGGFTLIELLVVIAILSVLAAIVIINVTGVKSTANTAACSTDAQTVQTALDEYYNATNDTYPAGFTGGATITDVSALAPYLSTTNLTGPTTACKSFGLSASSNGDLTVTGNANT